MDCKYGFQSILFFLVASLSASANVLDFKVSKQFRVQGTFKEVCETMGYSDNLLIEAKGLVALDCMGRVVKINDFCLRKKEKKRVFLRGYLNPKDSSVICQYGNSASLSLSCETKKNQKLLCLSRTFLLETEKVFCQGVGCHSSFQTF